MTLLPKVKLKALVSFPATILDGIGVDVVRQNGSYQFNIAYDDFAPPISAPSLPDTANLTALLWNVSSGSYVLTPISLLGGQGGIANPLMDGVVAPGIAPAFSHEDHRHPTDTTLVSKSANLSDVVDAAISATNLGVVRYAGPQALTPPQQSQARSNIAVPGANVVINGDFRVNQAGYVSAAVLGAGLYGHDQWKAGASGGDYSFTQLKSSTQITIASGKSLIQPIEDVNVVGGSYVLTWTGTAQARAGINTLTPSGTYAASPLSIAGQTAGTVMSIEFNNGTLGTVKLESGTIASPFIMRPYDQELATCRRYFLTIGPGLNGVMAGTTAAQVRGSWGVEMRITPVPIATAPLNIDNDISANFTQSSAQVAINNVNTNKSSARFTLLNFSGLTSGTYCGVTDVGGKINLDARL